MKRFFVVICVIVCSLTSTAYDFKVDGIYYNLISPTQLTCEVTYFDINNNSNTYRGNISIPETVKYNGKTISVIAIGECAFFDCENLMSVQLPNTLTCIKSSAFQKCKSIKTLSIPGSVKSIKAQAFWGMTDLTSIEFLDGEENLQISKSNPSPNSAVFYRAFNIKTMYLGRNLSSEIGLFESNIPLKTLEIGQFVKEINHMNSPSTGLTGTAFSDCKNLTTIRIYASTPPTLAYEYTPAFSNYVYINATLYVPKGCLALYQNAKIWGNFWNILEGSWTTDLDNIIIGDKNNQNEKQYFNLLGQPVLNPVKGEIYIYKGGKKFF